MSTSLLFKKYLKKENVKQMIFKYLASLLFSDSENIGFSINLNSNGGKGKSGRVQERWNISLQIPLHRFTGIR